MLSKLALEHFGYVPEVISTTEHDHPMIAVRQLSSLIMLYNMFRGYNILRIVMHDSDRFVEMPCATNRIYVKSVYKDIIKILSVASDKNIDVSKMLKNYIQYEDFMGASGVAGVFDYACHISMWANSIPILKEALCGPVCYSNSVSIREWIIIAFTNDRIVNDAVSMYLSNKLKCERVAVTTDLLRGFVYSEKVLSYKLILCSFMTVSKYHFGNDYGYVGFLNELGGAMKQATSHKKDFMFTLSEGVVRQTFDLSRKSKVVSLRSSSENIQDLFSLSLLLGQKEVCLQIISQVNTLAIL